MKYIDRSKRVLINVIQSMPIEDYESLLEMLHEECEITHKSENEQPFFTCKNCRKKYGECNIEYDGDEECSARFRKYMQSEVQE